MSEVDSAGQSIPPLFLKWNEFSDLLGGASWEEACTDGNLALLSSQTRQQLPLLASRFSEHSQFLFSDLTSAFKPMEVLWLKWRLFGGLCCRLLHRYQTTHRPSLGIRPDQIAVLVPAVGDSVFPARWNFWVDLLSPQGANLFVNEQMPLEFSNQIFEPPHAVDNLYQAPELKVFPLGTRLTGSGMIRNMERLRHSNGGVNEVRGLVQLHLFHESLTSSLFSEKDVFGIKFFTTQNPPFPVGIWASKADVVDRGLSLNGTTLPMSPAQWEGLEAQRQQVFGNIEIVVYRAFNTPCDLYSLGVILLQLLIGRTTETLERLRNRLPILIGEVQKMVTKISEYDTITFDKQFKQLLEREGRLFKKEGILYESLKSEGAVRSISDELWFEMLQVGFRLVSRVPHFGFCRHVGDFLHGKPEEPLQRVLVDVERVGQWTQQELFGSPTQNREILAVCQMFRKELSNKGKLSNAL